MVYELQNGLQVVGIIINWNPRARVGLYLVPSPMNVSYVSQTINLKTATVSHKFHIQPGKLFDMLLPTDGNTHTLSHCKQIYDSICGRLHNLHTQQGVSGTEPFIPARVKKEILTVTR